jgi:hypothetical protein
MFAIVLPVLASSLLGSVHCAAMCGGFVCLYAGDTRGWKGHVAYNGGRLVSYLVAGAIAGTVGASVNRAGAFVGLSRAAAIVGGGLLVLWGASLALRALGVRWFSPRDVSLPQRLLGPLLQRTRGRSATIRAGAIGLLSTLLPCGWLYAFVVTAGGTGRITSALLVMTAFWAGTLPAMLTVGAGLQRLTGPLRTRLPLLTAAAVMVIGALTMAGRLAAPLQAHTHRSPTHDHR